MALAPSRNPLEDTVRYALNEVAARGRVCCMSSTVGEVTVTAVPTGVGTRPVGVLLDDVEDMNYDRHGEYRQRNVVDVGSVVGIATKGVYETDMISGTPSQGQVAYLHNNGYVSPTRLTDGVTPAPAVGYFMSAKNANGFAAVKFDL